MGLGPEQQVVQQQFFQLLQRVSLFKSQTTSVALSSTVIVSAGFNPLPQPLSAGVAIRLVRIVGTVQDAANTGKLNVAGFLIQGFGASNSEPMVAASFPVYSIAPITNSPAQIEYSSGELIIFSDYAENGGLTAGFGIQSQCTVTNTDGAAAHSIIVTFTALLEYFQLKSGGHVGFP